MPTSMYTQALKHLDTIMKHPHDIFQITKYVIENYVNDQQFNAVVDELGLTGSHIGETLSIVCDLSLHNTFNIEPNCLLEKLKRDIHHGTLVLNTELFNHHVDSYDIDPNMLDTLFISNNISFLLTYMPEHINASSADIAKVQQAVMYMKAKTNIAILPYILKEILEIGCDEFISKHHITKH